MADRIDFSAFKVDEAGHFLAKVREATAAGKAVDCGWVPPHERTAAQARAAADADAALPRFTLRGRFAAGERRYKLWAALRLVAGGTPYFWQQTGSCVGAGFGNAAKTCLAVDIAVRGEAEEYKEIWWPFNYGRGRALGGIRGRGEGSFGSAQAKQAVDEGFFEVDPAGEPDLPDYKSQGGWLVQSAAVEMDWSDGAKIPANWLKLGRNHRFGAAARMRSKDDCFEAVANGYAITQASSFGFSAPRVKGTREPIRVAEWNGTWNHQTYVDEAWDHPELNGIFFRWGNNWGPDAHGKPTGDEPTGGVYIHESLMDRLCKEGEVFAFSGSDGFPARDLPNFDAFRFPKRTP